MSLDDVHKCWNATTNFRCFYFNTLITSTFTNFESIKWICSSRCVAWVKQHSLKSRCHVTMINSSNGHDIILVVNFFQPQNQSQCTASRRFDVFIAFTKQIACSCIVPSSVTVISIKISKAHAVSAIIFKFKFKFEPVY